MDRQQISALLIDDDPDYPPILERQLSGVPEVAVDFRYASSAVDGLGLLHQHDVDIVFLDYRLGQHDGLEVLSEIRKVGDDRAIIMITGEGSEDVAASSFREGADDYLAKSRVTPERLARAIKNARTRCVRRRMAAEMEEAARRLAEANEELAALTRHDELTGLCTRRYFSERLEQEMLRARRFKHPISLLFIDVDHFKSVNDEHGHGTGDRVLAGVGELIRNFLRGSDLAARYGGDELCVMLAETSMAGACVFAERLLERIRQHPFELPDGSTLRVTTSIGVATLGGRSDTLEQLLERADAALYEAKRAGRDGYAAAADPDGDDAGPKPD